MCSHLTGKETEAPGQQGICVGAAKTSQREEVVHAVILGAVGFVSQILEGRPLPAPGSPHRAAVGS